MAKSKLIYMRNFTTNAKYIVNNWASFSELATTYGSSAKTEAANILHNSALLEDAFNGGFSFCFRGLTDVLVQIEQVLIMVRAGKEDAESLTPDLLAQFDCSKVEVTRLMPAKIEKLRKKILGKIAKLDESMKKLHATACEAVVTHLREREVLLNENEHNELVLIETRQALVRRLDNLSLAALETDEVLSFSRYFRCKTSVVVKNALSRLQQRHGDNEVEQTLRKMKPCFEAIEKEKEKFVAANIQPLKQWVEDALRIEPL